MRALVIAIVSFATLDIPGCVECKNPICLPDDPDLVFDEKLLGEFEPVDRHPNQTRGFFRVERKAPESRVYRLTLHTFPSTKKADDAAESVKEPGDPLECGILKLGDYRILVTFGLTKKRPDDLAWGLMLIEHTEPNLQLRLLNPEYFEANPKDLPFSRRKAVFDMVDVVTLESSAEQLRLFLRAHAHKPSLWTAPIRWKRRDADQAPQTPVPHRSDSAPDG